ncbi:MAG: substrate-binding domain-containing protein [Oscillospiraceae bacterium]|nr:substrate-binding domain-containing protein [Oscillospiraceae bacterium]
MKKFLTVALSTVLGLSLLGACSGGTTETTTTTTATTAAETTTTAGTTAAATAETTTAATTASQSGGSDSSLGNIVVYTRDSASGTREAFQSIVGFGDTEKDQAALTSSAIEVSNNGDMATKVGQDVNGIGYVSLTTDLAANNLKALSFDGVEPTEANVLNGSYELARPFNYVTRASGDFSSDELEQLVEAFIAYLTESVEGRTVVHAQGGITDAASGTPWADMAADYPITQQDNSSLTIRTAGSTSVESTIQAALQSFQPLAGNFQFSMNQTGSGDGQKSVLGDGKDGTNAAEIGFASRSFKTEEDVSAAMATGTYAQDAVVIVVESSNSLSDIGMDLVRGVFTGDITAWSELQ